MAICHALGIVEYYRDGSRTEQQIALYYTVYYDTTPIFLGAVLLARPKGKHRARAPARTKTPQIRLDDQRVSLSPGDRARDEDLSMRNKPAASATLTAAEATKNPIAP